MASFENALTKTLLSEGGYGNDPSDPGGETYKGVARSMNGKWDGWPLVDALKRQPGFPANLEKSVELQTKVSEFYRSAFWDRVQGDDIADQDVAHTVFDFAVNAGVGTSVVLAQHVVEVTPDGVLGNNTLSKINEAKPEYFLAAFTVAKIARYVGIVNKRPESRKYFFGWISRALNN